MNSDSLSRVIVEYQVVSLNFTHHDHETTPHYVLIPKLLFAFYSSCVCHQTPPALFSNEAYHLLESHKLFNPLAVTRVTHFLQARWSSVSLHISFKVSLSMPLYHPSTVLFAFLVIFSLYFLLFIVGLLLY